MNFLQRLFKHESSTDRAACTSYDWPGKSGKEYHFEIFPVGETFRPLPGIYIYAKQLSDGDWSPIYISQTRDLHQRLEGHVKLTDAVANGATHLHAHYCTAGQSARFSEEHDLVERWQPVCNDSFAS